MRSRSGSEAQPCALALALMPVGTRRSKAPPSPPLPRGFVRRSNVGSRIQPTSSQQKPAQIHLAESASSPSLSPIEHDGSEHEGLSLFDGSEHDGSEHDGSEHDDDDLGNLSQEFLQEAIQATTRTEAQTSRDAESPRHYSQDPEFLALHWRNSAERKAALAAIKAVRCRSIIIANKRRAMQIKSLKTELERISVQMGMHENELKMLRTARRRTHNELLRIRKDMK